MAVLKMAILTLMCLNVVLSSSSQNGCDHVSIIPTPRDMECGSQSIPIQNCVELIDASNSLTLKGYSHFKFGADCDFKIKFEHLDSTKPSPTLMMPEGLDASAEEYEISIDSPNLAIVKSRYLVGTIRAMDTFAQLLVPDSEDESKIMLQSFPIKICDKPRYAYRGLMLDVSREYYPLHTLKQILDGLRMTKINVLHLHLSDDDSFPVQFPSFPHMTHFTAFSPKETYSEADIKEVIRYAYENGVKIIPEFDTPGHSRAIGQDTRFKEILTCFDHLVPWDMPDGSYIEGGPSSAVLNPSHPKTTEFLDKLAHDVTELFKHSDFYHFGGDEVNFEACWETNPEIKEYMKEHNLTSGIELFNFFNSQIQEIVDKYTDKPVVHWIWEQDFHTTWKNNSVLQYWGSSESIPEFKSLFPNQKHILSPTDYSYLDCGYGNRYGQQLCNPIKTWAHMATFEPTDYYDESDDTLLGGEACMWSELNTPYNVFNKVWPRLSVLSNIYWSPKQSGPYRWDKIVKDLVAFRDFIQRNGIPANKISSRYGETHPEEVFKRYEKSLLSQGILNPDGEISEEEFKKVKVQLAELFENFI